MTYRPNGWIDSMLQLTKIAATMFTPNSEGKMGVNGTLTANNSTRSLGIKPNGDTSRPSSGAVTAGTSSASGAGTSNNTMINSAGGKGIKPVTSVEPSKPVGAEQGNDGEPKPPQPPKPPKPPTGSLGSTSSSLSGTNSVQTGKTNFSSSPFKKTAAMLSLRSLAMPLGRLGRTETSFVRPTSYNTPGMQQLRALRDTERKRKLLEDQRRMFENQSKNQYMLQRQAYLYQQNRFNNAINSSQVYNSLPIAHPSYINTSIF